MSPHHYYIPKGLTLAEARGDGARGAQAIGGSAAALDYRSTAGPVETISQSR
jgi:hypothetical protein